MKKKVVDKQVVEQEVRKNPETELRVRITEDADGKFNVQWESDANGVAIQMRASHVIGQLVLGAIVIAIKEFKGISGVVDKITR